MLIGLLKLSRLYYCLPMALTFLLTVYYARGGLMAGHWRMDVLATMALSLVIAGAYALNDLVDVKVDRVNAPDRPLVQGALPAGVAWAAATGLMSLGVWLGFCFGENYFPWVLSAVTLGLIGYDLTSKRLGDWKAWLVAVLMTSIYPMAYAQAAGASGSRAATLPAFAAWMLLSSAGYQIIKDLRDRKGDRLATNRPTAIQKHPRRWRGIAHGLVLLGAMMLVLPLFLGSQWVYGLVIVPAVGFSIWRVLHTRRLRGKIVWIYVEFVAVGVATTLDALITGF